MSSLYSCVFTVIATSWHMKVEALWRSFLRAGRCVLYYGLCCVGLCRLSPVGLRAQTTNKMFDLLSLLRGVIHTQATAVEALSGTAWTLESVPDLIGKT